MNTVLEKFFEAPEPPSPAKNDENADNDEEEEDKDEEEKASDDKENEKKKAQSREVPVALGTDDFRPPYGGDDDPEDDVQK